MIVKCLVHTFTSHIPHDSSIRPKCYSQSLSHGDKYHICKLSLVSRLSIEKGKLIAERFDGVFRSATGWFVPVYQPAYDAKGNFDISHHISYRFLVTLSIFQCHVFFHIKVSNNYPWYSSNMTSWVRACCDRKYVWVFSQGIQKRLNKNRAGKWLFMTPLCYFDFPI